MEKLIFIHENDAELFVPPLHFKCQSRWYFKKGVPSCALSVARTDFEPGGYGDWHCHEEADQAYYIIIGTARVWMDDEINYVDLFHGDMVLFPKGRKHKVQNLGDQILSAVAINAPAL